MKKIKKITTYMCRVNLLYALYIYFCIKEAIQVAGTCGVTICTKN